MNNLFNVQAWLAQPVNDEPRYRRLCWLAVAAGSWHPTAYGFISNVDGHQYGLEIDEFFELREASSYMCGLRDAGVPVFEAMDAYLLAYVTECGLPFRRLN